MKPSFIGRWWLLSVVFTGLTFFSTDVSLPHQIQKPTPTPSTQLIAFSPDTPPQVSPTATIESRTFTNPPLRPPTTSLHLLSLDDFIRQVKNGKAGELRGFYVEGRMALRIVQQPNGNPAFVSREQDSATQYHRAGLYGTIGLLAHNFLAGRKFFDLSLDQDLVIIFGDGQTQQFRIDEISDYQRITRADIHSDFVELDTQSLISANEVFEKYYQVNHSLVLQTCIERDGIPDWGVRFIRAEPVGTK